MDNMEKFKERLEYYKNLFGLQNWDIVVKPLPKVDFNAQTVADPRYFTASIQVQMGLPDEQYERIIIHELIHVAMALYDFYSDNFSIEGSQKLFFTAREGVVSQLTQIMLRMCKLGNEKN